MILYFSVSLTLIYQEGLCLALSFFLMLWFDLSEGTKQGKRSEDNLPTTRFCLVSFQSLQSTGAPQKCCCSIGAFCGSAKSFRI